MDLHVPLIQAERQQALKRIAQRAVSDLDGTREAQRLLNMGCSELGLEPSTAPRVLGVTTRRMSRFSPVVSARSLPVLGVRFTIEDLRGLLG